MRISQVKYKMLRVTDKSENDAVEITVEVQDGDNIGAAVRAAKHACKKALATSTSQYEGY